MDQQRRTAAEGRVSTERSLVGVTACRQAGENRPSHRVGEKYITAMTEAAGGLSGPTAGAAGREAARHADPWLVGTVDPAGASNVDPGLPGGGDSATPDHHDPARDAVRRWR